MHGRLRSGAPVLALKNCLTPELCRRYEYVFIWMDDLDVMEFDPQHFLHILRRYHIEVAQPALSSDSVISHPMTGAARPIGRYTDFVEIMAFVFRGDLWERFWRLIEPDRNPWGWGYDEVAYSVCGFRRLAIVDCEAIRHLRKGSYHAAAGADQSKTHRRCPALLLSPQANALLDLGSVPASVPSGPLPAEPVLHLYQTLYVPATRVREAAASRLPASNDCNRTRQIAVAAGTCRSATSLSLRS